MTTRRDFLRLSAAMLAATAVPDSLLANTHAPEKKIGLQLYSVRDDIKNDFDGTMKSLVKIGYKRFEAAGYRNGLFYGKTPSDIKKYMGDLGAMLTGSHTGTGLLRTADDKGWDFWKKCMPDTVEAGCKWVVQAGYPECKTIDEVKMLADMFNKVGEMAKASGLKFAFHNHVTEFKPISGEIPYDVLLQRTDPTLVTFQMDTCQVFLGGGSCTDYIKKYPGRFSNWHVKDPHPTKDESTELGTGRLDFAPIFALANRAGLEDYYVEQESYSMSPLEAVKHDYNYLNKASFVKW